MKKRITWVSAVVVVLCLVGWTAHGQLQQGGGATNRTWEYQVMPVQNVEMGQKVLREMGGRGWELAAVQPVHGVRISPAERDFRPGEEGGAFYFFKRLK